MLAHHCVNHVCADLSLKHFFISKLHLTWALLLVNFLNWAHKSYAGWGREESCFCNVRQGPRTYLSLQDVEAHMSFLVSWRLSCWRSSCVCITLCVLFHGSLKTLLILQTYGQTHDQLWKTILKLTINSIVYIFHFYFQKVFNKFP